MFRQFKLLGWSLVFLVASILTLSYYFQEGMFFDGITYSALGRNLYLGYGSFWSPYYNEIFNPFYNHPPLLYWILSKFYWIIGDSMYVPKIYNLVVLVVSMLLIRSLWLKMDEKNQSIDWWPFILWFSCSVVFNTYRNTMLENTLTLFTLASIRFLMQLVTHHKKVILYLTLSSVFIFLGFLTKGFVALFPLSFMIIHLVLFKSSLKKIIIYTIFLLSGFGICYYLFITMNVDSKPYFNYYYNQHVLKAVSGNEALTNMGRYFLILQLLLELSPFIALSIIATILNRRYALKVNYKMVLFFILIGISASFPLFISPKQRTYYLLPSIPYFILAFALWTQPLLVFLIGKIKGSKKYIMVAFLLILIGIGYMAMVSQLKEKDADLIADCRKLDKFFPEKTLIHTNADLAMNWRVMAYLSRIGIITLTNQPESKFILVTKGERVDEKLKQVDLDLKLFELYEKN